MTISDTAVEAIVNEAINWCNSPLSSKTSKDVIKEAWQTVNARRLGGDISENLAAAEHYLYCRFTAGLGGHVTYLLIMGMKAGYDLLKIIGVSYQESEAPVSPVSREDWYWSHEGAKDGIDDFFGKYSRSVLRCRNRYYYNAYVDEVQRQGGW